MRHPLDHDEDGEIYRYFEKDGRLYRAHISRNEDAILEHNAAVRGNGGPRKFAWGKWIASIPLATWEVLIKRHPGLNSNDPDERFKAWERFSKDSDYRKLTFGD